MILWLMIGLYYFVLQEIPMEQKVALIFPT